MSEVIAEQLELSMQLLGHGASIERLVHQLIARDAGERQIVVFLVRCAKYRIGALLYGNGRIENYNIPVNRRAYNSKAQWNHPCPN